MYKERLDKLHGKTFKEAQDTKGVLRKYKSEILKFPRNLSIDGHNFKFSSSTAESLIDYTRGKRASIEYSSYDKETKKELGFDEFEVIFKWQGDSLKFSDISPR